MERGSLHDMLVAFAGVFSQPSFRSFVVLLEGWIVAGARGMTSTALAARGAFAKHYASYYRFFSDGAWSADAVGRVLLELVLPFAPRGPLVVAVDDTLARKSGKHIWGANLHHDPLAWLPHALAFGHNWVVLAVVVRVPLVERFVAVPVFWRLYRSQTARTGKTRRGKRESKTTGAASAAAHRTRPELAVELLQVLRKALGNGRMVRVVGDSAYSGKSVTRRLPEHTVCVSRLPMNAALYDVAPPRRPGQRGCPRKKGARLKSPEQMAADTTRWREATVRLYGKNVAVLYKDRIALWYNSTRAAPLHIVVVRDPKRRRRDEAFFSTQAGMPVETILETYAQRWSLEVAFRDAKQQLGFERSRARTRKAVERTGPFAFVTYAIAIAWFCRTGHHHYPTMPIMPWYRHKRGPSFADMQTLLKRELLEQGFSHTPKNMRPFKKPTRAKTHAQQRAA
jgi:SRSO17 transposase